MFLLSRLSFPVQDAGGSEALQVAETRPLCSSLSFCQKRWADCSQRWFWPNVTRWMWGVAMQCLTVEKSLQARFNSLSLAVAFSAGSSESTAGFCVEFPSIHFVPMWSESHQLPTFDEVFYHAEVKDMRQSLMNEPYFAGIVALWILTFGPEVSRTMRRWQCLCFPHTPPTAAYSLVLCLRPPQISFSSLSVSLFHPLSQSNTHKDHYAHLHTHRRGITFLIFFTFFCLRQLS